MFTQSMKSREGRFDLEKQAFFQGQQTKIVNQIFNFIYNNSSIVFISKIVHMILNLIVLSDEVVFRKLLHIGIFQTRF